MQFVRTFLLELDDVVILSTDGLFDNVPDRLIETILVQSRRLSLCFLEQSEHYLPSSLESIFKTRSQSIW